MPHFKVICLNAEGLFKLEVHTFELPCAGSLFVRDRGTTLRLGGGGTVGDSIWGRGTRHFFLLTLYNSENIGGNVPPPPCSAVPVCMGSRM